MSRSSRYEEEEYISEDGEVTHPALKNYSRGGTQAKHVLGGTLKWGLIGALAGGALLGIGFAAFTTLGIFAVPFGPLIASVATMFGFGAQLAIPTMISAAVAGATVGGLIGAAGGAVASLSSSSDAADIEEDKLINKYEAAQARQDRLDRLREVRDRQMAAMQRQDMQMRGANPNYSLPRGRGAGGDGMTYAT